jgi:hypothetical protein
LVICYEAPTPHSIVKCIHNYEKKDYIESKVDGIPPFSPAYYDTVHGANIIFSKFLLNFKAQTYDWH